MAKIIRIPAAPITIGNRPEDDQARIAMARRYAADGKATTAALIAGSVRDAELRRPLLWELRRKEGERATSLQSV